MRICTMCETKYGDGERYCPVCGSPVSASRLVMNGTPQTSVRTDTGGGYGPGSAMFPDGGMIPSVTPVKKRSKLPWILLLLIFVIGIVGCAGYYMLEMLPVQQGKTAVKSYYQSLLDLDADACLAAYPPEVVEQYDSENGKRAFERKIVDKEVDYVERCENYTVEPQSARNVSDSEVRAYKEELESEGILLGIQDMVEVEMKHIVEQNGKKSTKTFTDYAIKVNDKWYYALVVE